MVFGCFDTMIVLLDGIVRRARGSSIYKKAPAHGDRSSILVGILLEKSRLTRELFLSRAQFSVVVSYRQPESPQDYESPDIWNSGWAPHNRHRSRAFQTSRLDSRLKVPVG